MLLNINLAQLSLDFDSPGFWILAIFWVYQFLGFLFWDRHLIENQNHRFAWFFVLLIGNILGALWFVVWKRQQRAERVEAMKEEKMDNLVDALKTKE